MTLFGGVSRHTSTNDRFRLVSRGAPVGVKQTNDLSEFAEFADALQGQRMQSERVVRLALRRVGDRYPGGVVDEMNDVANALESTLQDLDRAVEELRVQNEALF